MEFNSTARSIFSVVNRFQRSVEKVELLLDYVTFSFDFLNEP